ncbi:MAG: bifunctional glutamate N-acetyltransferase/amino-acid acetyltransferase ArgJ [Candidatus Omnitrophota bacterium]
MKSSPVKGLPRGFQANGVAAGIKRSGRPDLALFYSQAPAKVAAVFTSNSIKAAPLKVSQSYLSRNEYFQALIVNSGNANCFTGNAGLADARKMSLLAARGLGIRKEAVLVASTGIIARRMPLGKIENAIPLLVEGLSAKGIGMAGKAIMTTDTFAKKAHARVKVGKQSVTIYGVAKGAGMIGPKVATMLCFLFTDANIARGALDKALKAAADNSFNCITVDGCMSTNDMVTLFANGLAKNTAIESGRNFRSFSRALSSVCLELARMLVRDAEGATKFITVKVSGARSASEARRAALAVANSNLFKTAMFASSPNVLGRIVAAVGASGAKVKEEKLNISLGDLKGKEVKVELSLGCGRQEAVVYTSDLTYKYIKINAGYN